MNIKLSMVDVETGEILAHKYHNLACNLQTRNDAGFTKIMEWAQSCVKGVRTSDHKCIELRVAFSDEIEPQWIPFNDLEQAKENAQAYVY